MSATWNSVMRDFYQQRFNMLLCTTIIETGIDIPTANTIIINRADQIRPRATAPVARPRRPLAPPGLRLPAGARRREALTRRRRSAWKRSSRWKNSARGFYLAMHDLEIRGAGEVLGESQIGEMQEIGFQLYTDMLNAAVHALKTGQGTGSGRAAAASPPKSICTRRRCCPTTIAATSTSA